jgi:hypothetical protein
MVGIDQIITEYHLLDNNNNQAMTSFIFSKVKVKSQTQDWKHCLLLLLLFTEKKHQSRRKLKRRKKKKQKKGRRKQNPRKKKGGGCEIAKFAILLSFCRRYHLVSWSLFCKVQKLELVPILLYNEGIFLFFYFFIFFPPPPFLQVLHQEPWNPKNRCSKNNK